MRVALNGEVVSAGPEDHYAEPPESRAPLSKDDGEGQGVVGQDGLAGDLLDGGADRVGALRWGGVEGHVGGRLLAGGGLGD
jgi:hypothetical protein